MADRTLAETVAAALDSPELQELIQELEALRWDGKTGNLGPRGYGARALLGACLVKSLYGFSTWAQTARLIREHPVLQDVLGGAPSKWACYRFAGKLRGRRDLLVSCAKRVTTSLRKRKPELGRDVAIDSTDLAAYANGQK